MNNNVINETSLFFGKIKDKTECKTMKAIIKQINRLLIVIQYWFILWLIAHIIIMAISMKLTYSILYIVSWIFVLSGYIKYALDIHKQKYHIHNHTMIQFGRTQVMRIFIQYAQNMIKYIRARGRNMNDQNILLMREGWIANSDFLSLIFSTSVR